MPRPFTVLFGKAVQATARLRGGGSALPGLFVEKIDKNFVRDTLSTLPYGVVVISGTNGKTTTAKIVAELLQGQGLKVFTNKTGSNFVRGVASALLTDISLQGKLDADIAVLELDEAHGVHFVKATAPRYSLILNVMRDQLDRFGEIDSTAKLLHTIANYTKEAVILNREDPRVAAIANDLTKNTTATFFGINPELRKTFPNDDELHSAPIKTKSPKALATLDSFTNTKATFKINGESFTTTTKLKGVYNLFNAAAALSLVKTILPNSKSAKLIKTLSTITPAFGRGESFIVNGQPLELVLVKNPSGFRLGLLSFPSKGYKTMIAVNDNYADGRDMSWLWDVDFSSLKKEGVTVVSGVRAYDMALRLEYDEVPVKHVTENLQNALKAFIKSGSGPKRIYCTYTAMLTLRREVSKIAKGGNHE